MLEFLQQSDKILVVFLILRIKLKSFNSSGFLVPPSYIYLLMNYNWPIIALYSTWKCDDGAHLSFIGSYMCEGISILTYTYW